MKIRILGCHGGELKHQGTCGFLINDSLLLDAGTVCSALNLSEQSKIRHVLISHTHVDHIKSLPLLADNFIGDRRRSPIVILSLSPVIASLKRNLFNNRIWPDFTKIPRTRRPYFRLKAIRKGEAIAVGDLTVRAFAVNHTIPCAGFILQDKNGSLLYSGDTHVTEGIWKAAAKTPRLNAALIETSFPDRLGPLAVRSRHLTPRLLAQEFGKIGRPDLPLYIYHMKPRFRREIAREVGKLRIARVTMLNEGMVLTV